MPSKPGAIPSGRPSRSRVLAVLGVFVLVVGAGIAGYLLSLPRGPIATPSAVVTTLQAPLQLPHQAGSFVRDSDAALRPTTDPSTGALSMSATYTTSAGRPALIVVASRPSTDATTLLRDAGAPVVHDVADGSCGRTARDLDACALLEGNTALLVVALQDQTPLELMQNARTVADALP